MEDEWCELLTLRAIPHLLDPKTNTILELEGISPAIPQVNFPQSLAREINSLASELKTADKVQYYTITHKVPQIETGADYFAMLELVPQPYVFYDVAQEHNQKTTSLDYAMYLPNSSISNSSFKQIENNIKINPKRLKDSKVRIEINTQQQKLSSTSQFLISTLMPVQVFYTLMLVYYNNKVARALITRNIVVFNTESNLALRFIGITTAEWFEDKARECAGLWVELSNVSKRNQMEFDTCCFRILAQELANNGESHWKNRMFYYVYKLSGEPQGDTNFGENEYLRLVELSFMAPEDYWRLNLNSEFLNKCFGQVLKEIFDMALEL